MRCTLPIRPRSPEPDNKIPSFDLRKMERMPDGKRTFAVRCRVPFVLDALFTRASVTSPPPVVEKTEGSEPETRAAPVQPAARAYAGPAGNLKGPTIHGIASSTGRDQHGTEMSERALRQMEAQFNRGSIVYLPRHPSWSGGGGEWDDVMGYVGRAEVVPAEVPEQNPGEQGFALAVEVQLDGKDPASGKLSQRIADGYEIGQSIGGWFTELCYIYAEGDSPDNWDDPERVIIEGIELDHLAATRSPSNTASWIEAVRGAAMDAHTRSLAATRAAPAPTKDPEMDPEMKAAPMEDDPTEEEPMPDEPTGEEPMPTMCPECGAEMSGKICKACAPEMKADTIQGATQVEPDPPAVEPAQEASEQEPTPLPPEDDGTRSKKVDLDGSKRTGHAMDNTGTDALRGAPGDELSDRTRPDIRQESTNMNPETLTVEQLQAKIAELENEKAQRAAEDEERQRIERSSRRGQVVQYRGVPGTQRDHDRLVTRARDEGLDEICDVVTAPGFVQRAELGRDGLSKLSVADLEADLRAIITGAEEDGLVRNPFDNEAVGAWA